MTENRPGEPGAGPGGTPRRPAPTRPVPPRPAVDPAMREYAREHPGEFLYVLDPAVRDAADVPPWAVAGAYPISDGGELLEDAYRPNPDHRPSPAALGLPAPASELEVALQLAVTGHDVEDGGIEDGGAEGGGTGRGVTAALRDATVLVPFVPDRPGLAVRDEGGDRPVVHVFSSDRYLPGVEVWRHWLQVRVAEIAEGLRGYEIVVDPGTVLELRVSGADLAEAAAQAPASPESPESASPGSAR